MTAIPARSPRDPWAACFCRWAGGVNSGEKISRQARAAGEAPDACCGLSPTQEFLAVHEAAEGRVA